MSKYLGSIEIKNGGYVNFKPTYQIKQNGEFKYLTYDDKAEIFPGSQLVNVNLYYKNFGKKPAQTFEDNEVVVLDFDFKDLEENYDNWGNRNQTGFKLEIDNLFNKEKIIELDNIGIGYLISTGFLEGNYRKNKILKITDPFVTSGYDVFVDLNDGTNRVIGPYKAKVNDNDESIYIDTSLQEAKYVLNGYEFYDLSEAIIEMSINDQKLRFINTNASNIDLEEILIDVISDDELVADFKRTLEQSDTVDGKLDLDNIDAVLENQKKSSLFSDSIPEDIKADRTNRIKALLTEEKRFSDIANDLAGAILNQLVRQQSKKEISDFLEKLIGTPEFMAGIQKFQIIQQKNEELTRSKEQLTQDIADLDEKISNKIQEIVGLDKQIEEKKLTAKEEPRQKSVVNETKSIKVDINQDQTIAMLTAAKEKAMAELRQIKEGKDLAEIIGGLRKDIADNQGKIDTQREQIASYNKELKDVDKRLKKIFDNNTEKAMNFAFDGMLSNRMLKQAAEWEEAQSLDSFEKKIEDINELAISELKDAQLVQYLVDNIQKVRPNYQRNEIINIVICITQGFLTVFSGEPGTGKTSICRIIASTLGLSNIANKLEEYNDGFDANRYLAVSVERGWTTKRDFVGYYNPLTKSFDRSNRRVYDCLNILDLEAKGNCVDLPYVILLDEANLSPMEYYWADFMNICDNHDGSGNINLGNDFCYRIPNNLRFMATINNDHTTEALSPRLVDRAWIIKLPKVKPSEVSEEKYCNQDFELISWNSLEEIFDVESSEAAPMSGTVKDTYNDIITRCSQLGMAVSPRSASAVKKYWAIAQKWFEDDKVYGIDASIVALDYATAQRILPHIDGSGEAFCDKLKQLKDLCKERNLLMSSAVISDIIEKGNATMQYYQYFG